MMQSSLGNLGGCDSSNYPSSSSFRMRNNSYSTTPFPTHYQSTSPIHYSHSPTLQTPPPTTFNNGQTTSIQQFLNSDMLASMSRSNSQPDLTATLNSVASGINQLTSSKSMSVCSDDLYMDIGGCNNSSVVDDLFLGIEADFIGTSDLSDFFENDYFSEFDDTRSLFQQLVNSSSPLPAPPPPQRSAPPSPKPQPKNRSNSNGRHLPTKLWSKMTSHEQTAATEDLTRTINEQLGRREQLEIIRILQPDGPQLLPQQTQFVLDFSGMNDEKHRRIRNIIKFNLIGNGGSMNDESDGYSSLSSNKSDPLSQRIEKALKLRHRKEQRQAAKEHRSGLFNAQHHQVLELTKCDEDIEVDILS